MLCELAMFVKHQGRQTEALALYEESVGILAKHLATAPFDYFVGLNNYGICFIHLKDFESAQRILEKAIDMILAARKREADRYAVMPLQQVQTLEFVLHLNLAFLFMEMHELREAELQLRDADALEPLLTNKAQAGWEDHYIAICAMWEFEASNYVEAEREIAQARNPEYPACLRLRARLQLAKQQFAEAEDLTRRYFAFEKKKGTLHRPDLLKATLELAEALFGQGKRDDALAAFQEARSIVADFALPHDAEWGKTLEVWATRARQLDRLELADALEKELAAISARPSKAIMILEKFRVHSPSEPEA
jgi:tetratricopeptide (TPR) repeat protein